ncbi:MAG: hypothetical protein RI988_2141 [Pseudomonadota bacterium]|jgi:tripartite-type tricarboxylate transporter receptor subunit TctC
MSTFLRTLGRLAAAFACSALATPLAWAQAPCASGSTVKFLVPFPASGSSADGLARAVSAELAKMWGKTVIVENKPGAGGVASTQAVATSAPDGCTVGLVTAAISINPSLMKKRLPYDTLKDLTMLSVLVDIPVGLFANPALPFKTVPELLAYAKTVPQGLDYGTPGVGSGSHLAGELLAHMTGARLNHVPYRGAAPAELDLMAGRIPLMIVAVSSEVAQIKAGKVRLIAVTGDKRFSGFPDVPTIGETVPGYATPGYFGVVGPGGMDKGLASRISQDIAKALQMPEVKRQLDMRGLVPIGSTPEQFERLVRSEMQTLGRVVEATGMSTE